ncbi:MAG: hypothetical protein [Siphoviridae sp. ctjeG17]|nr:MAG: hypothetical protein [Siphoviridae sp. ctjeG17]
MLPFQKVTIVLLLVSLCVVGGVGYVAYSAPEKPVYMVNGEKCELVNWNMQYIQAVCGDLKTVYTYENKPTYEGLADIVLKTEMGNTKE